MLRDWCADLVMSVGVLCVARADRLHTLATRWNRRARWLADVAEWLTTHKTWREVCDERGQE